jgi:hypothetical protein
MRAAVLLPNLYAQFGFQAWGGRSPMTSLKLPR